MSSLFFFFIIKNSINLSNLFKLDKLSNITDIKDFFLLLESLSNVSLFCAGLFIISLSLAIGKLVYTKKEGSFFEKIFLVFKIDSWRALKNHIKKNIKSILFTLMVFYLVRISLLSSLNLDIKDIYDITFYVICLLPLMSIIFFLIERFKGNKEISLFQYISLENIVLFISTIYGLTNYVHPTLFPIIATILNYFSSISLLDITKFTGNFLNHLPGLSKLHLDKLNASKFFIKKSIYSFNYCNNKIKSPVFCDYKFKSFKSINITNNFKQSLEFKPNRIKGMANVIFENSLFNKNRLYIIQKSKSSLELIFKTKTQLTLKIKLTLDKNTIDLINNFASKLDLKGNYLKSNNNLDKILSEKPYKYLPDLDDLNRHDPIERLLNGNPDKRSQLLRYTNPAKENLDVVVYTSRFNSNPDLSELLEDRENLDEQPVLPDLDATADTVNYNINDQAFVGVPQQAVYYAPQQPAFVGAPQQAVYYAPQRSLIQIGQSNLYIDSRIFNPLDYENARLSNEATDSLWRSLNLNPPGGVIDFQHSHLYVNYFNALDQRGQPNINYPSRPVRMELHNVLHALCFGQSGIRLSEVLISCDAYCHYQTIEKVHELLRKIIWTQPRLINLIRNTGSIQWSSTFIRNGTMLMRILRE